MNPSFKQQLKAWSKQHHESTPKKTKKTKYHQKPKKEKSEQLSDLDIKNLMGIDKRGLRRGKGGAWR